MWRPRGNGSRSCDCHNFPEVVPSAPGLGHDYGEAVTIMSVSGAFEKARADKRAALVGYLPAGYPTVDGGIAGIRAMVEAGVDIVEVGFPYSDPVIDGPVIQRAAEIALRGGVRSADVIRTVEAVTSAGASALVMSYWNPIERYGVDAFARDLAAAGGAG